MSTDPLSRAVAELAVGRMVVLRDDREFWGEGNLLVAAESADAEAINFMATEARGLVCLVLSAERCEELRLERIGRGNESSLGDSAMVSIEARNGVTTGISAADRARTIAVAVDPDSAPEDLVRPGHVFPLRARPGGVLERPARIEAAVELTLAAGLGAAAVLCQVIRDDGRMARGEDLELFASRHGLEILGVSDVLDHVRATTSTPADAVDEGRLMRQAMGYFATGVTVVTARDESGGPVGTTANAVSSVSLEPPLLLVCLARTSETLTAIRADGRFAVNILADRQRHHSDRFARKGESAHTQEVAFQDHDLGVPQLPGALTTIACEVDAIHPAGDHEIVVGRARHLEHGDSDAEPLLFWRGSYSRIRSEKDESVA